MLLKMIRFGVLVLIAVSVTKAATITGPTCTSDDDCSSTQCCYKRPEFEVVSKRRNTFEGYPVLPTLPAPTPVPGVCMSYMYSEGDRCSPISRMNGQCVCNEKAGQSCQFQGYDDTKVGFERVIHRCSSA